MNDPEKLWKGIVNAIGLTLAIVIAAWALVRWL